jgi:hypothetical protein
MILMLKFVETAKAMSAGDVVTSYLEANGRSLCNRCALLL